MSDARYDNPDKFTVTADHIKLARRMWVSWDACETGAPAIDCKRPYGNSDVWNDVAEILGWTQLDEDDRRTWGTHDDFDDAYEDLRERALNIHYQMRHVIQIALVTGSMEPGTYHKREKYRSDSWERI